EKTLALMKSIEKIPREEFEIAKEKLIKNEIFSRESGEAEADIIGFALSVMNEVEYFSEYIEDLKKAKYEEFLKIISFLKEKPLIGYLIPQ
ncbi:MAG: insulinase family protein, partial [Desulfurobacteriaceae bacterium]